MKKIVVAVAAMTMLAACEQPPPAADALGDAQNECYRNYAVEGTPGLSNMNFRTWRDFPGLVDQQRALNNLRSAMMAQGFSNVTVDASAGALTALQDHSIPGREPVLRVSARRVGSGTRVDAVFMLKLGQTSDSTGVRRNICRIVDAANL
jgi:hypothetical protein